MLQAITRNKAEKFLKQDGTRIPREDLMTDVVFGGLRYFEPDQAGLALHWMMPDVVEFGTLVREVRLWPRRNRVEPDVVIDLIAPNAQNLRLIVECKWLDFVLTAEQLEKQWVQFGPTAPDVEGEVRHVLVVQRKIRVEPEAFISAHPEVRAVRTLLLWRELAASANSRLASQGSLPLNKWISDVVRVVDAADERAFSGWRLLPSVEISPTDHFVFDCNFWSDPVLATLIEPLLWRNN